MKIFKRIINILIILIFFVTIYLPTFRIYAYLSTIEKYSSSDKIPHKFFIAVINKNTNKKEIIELNKFIISNDYIILNKNSIFNYNKNKFVLRIDKNIYKLSMYSDDFEIYESYLLIDEKIQSASYHTIHAIMAIPAFFISLIIFCIIIYLKRKLLKY